MSDLHQRRSLYVQLAEAVARHKPDILALVGDFLDADFSHPPEHKVLSIIDTALMLADLSKSCRVVFVRGNHEDWPWPDFEEAWLATGRKMHALHGTAVAFGPLTIVGFPCYMGFSGHYDKGRRLDDYHYNGWLTEVMRSSGSSAQALWLMHEPPSDQLAGAWAYIPEWEKAIREFQPLVTVSGHDHNHPLQTGTWMTTLGRTKCVNGGQNVYPVPGRLIYCTLEFTFAPDGTPSLVDPGIQRYGV